MKKIEAFIQPEQFETVKKELFKAGVHKMSVSQVKGCGQQKGYTESFRGQVVEVNLLPKTKIEIAVNEEFVQPTVDAIVRGARTGTIGDGKIFVLDLPQCIRVRTGESGTDAIG
ncbi:P-II family nitrogen regulator [bacterium]|nr:P-II family nitrogen regulator [bacterium]